MICLLSRYFNFRGTGVTRVSTKVLETLQKKGYEVTTVSTKGSSLLSYFMYTAVEMPFRLPVADVYHSLATLEGLWLPKEKSVVTILDLFTTTNPERAGAGMGYSKTKLSVGRKYFDIGSRVASQARFITCISEKTKKDVIQYLNVPEEKIKVVRLGINETLSPKPRTDKVFRIGTLGQMDKRKRIDLLIKAFRKSRIDAELVVAGGGRDDIDGRLLKELCTGDPRIKLLGFLPEEKLSDFYNSLDVFIFPTWIEGYGLPIVEAMACKKPVVVLEDSIIPEELKSRCIVADNLDSVIRNYLHIEDICRRSNIDFESNYKFAQEHSWDNTVDQYIKIYKEITD